MARAMAIASVFFALLPVALLRAEHHYLAAELSSDGGAIECSEGNICAVDAGGAQSEGAAGSRRRKPKTSVGHAKKTMNAAWDGVKHVGGVAGEAAWEGTKRVGNTAGNAALRVGNVAGNAAAHRLKWVGSKMVSVADKLR